MPKRLDFNGHPDSLCASCARFRCNRYRCSHPAPRTHVQMIHIGEDGVHCIDVCSGYEEWQQPKGRRK